MTDDTTNTPYDESTVFHNPDTGAEWEVVGVHREYELAVDEVDQDGTVTGTAGARYPEDTLAAKVDRGDLEPGPAPEPEPDDDGDDHECEGCGEVFGSQQALAGHQPCAEAEAEAEQ